MRAWNLRGHLMALVVVTLVPVVVLSGAISWVLVRHERRAVEDGLRQTTRALMIAVDRELQKSVIALEALADSPALARGDLATFRREAEAARRSQAGWLTVIVADASGEQLVNLLRPRGSGMPPTVDRRTFDHVLATRQPVAGDVLVGAVTGGASFTVRVPVLRDGQARYVVTALIATDTMDAVLRAQRIPTDSVGSIIDGRGYHVVRTRDPERHVGRVASRDLIAAAGRADEGWYRGWTIDSQEIYAAFSRSPESRWTVAIGIPAVAVQASVRRALLAGVGAGVATLMAGVGLAMLFGRRLAMAIDGLSAAARALGCGLVPATAEGSIHEVNEVAHVIKAAAVERRLAEAERERLLARERAARRRAELAEQEHRTLGEALPAIIFTATPDGRADHFSQRWYELTGLAPADTMSLAWQRALHPEDRPRCAAAWARALEDGDGFDWEYRLRRRDGAYRWHRGRTQPLLDADGRLVKWITAATDVHDLTLARADAEAANRAKDDFLAVLSHELRTPLNAMFGWIRMLRRGGLDAAETTRAIDTIERNTRLQAQIIQDLLDVSSIVAGKVRLECRPIPVAAPLHAALDAAAPGAEGHGVQLERAIETGDAVVMADAGRLQQVFGNLVSNALKFTPRGGRVRVTASQDGETVAITVADSGKGIAADVLPHIFDRFRQADSSSTREHGGLGLGLAIVRHLVEMHGGTVTAQSEGADRGASFTVRLPVAGKTPVAAPAAARADVQDRRAALEGVRILVVDDERDGAGMLAAALGAAGADVRMAHDVDEALSLATATPFDIVLTDIAMPGRDGYALLRALRELRLLPSATPIVAVTAHAAAGDRNRALASGFAAHLAKPIDPIALVDEVAVLVRRPASAASPAS